jgi:transcriptional regulator with XRE-family HTH domain
MPSGNFFDISARIRQVRGKLKQSEFADGLGIPRPNLSRYESGRKPPAEVLQKIADYGGVTVKWLLTGKEEEKDVSKPLHPDQPPVAPEPARPCEIQEFLLAQVLQAVEEFWGNQPPGPKHRAHIITAVYNHCARTLEPPSYALVEEFEIDLSSSSLTY